MKQIFTALITLLFLFFGFFPVHATTSDTVQILVADNPAECLHLEGIFLNGDNYILIDGRNNTGRVKIVGSDGAVNTGILSTLPLPYSASLPSDILPSPWGMDRVIPSGDFLWAAPAPWAGSVAEKFDRASGEFISRLEDIGTRTSGLAIGPDGNIWAISRRILVDITSGNSKSLNLGATLQHIDNAVGHPLGFIIFQQPDLFLVELTGLIRWRINLDSVVENYISPTDIACGSDGTIAVCGELTDLSDPENLAQYNSLREEALSRDDEEVLFSLEDALRSNLNIGYVLLLIDPDGTVSDAIEIPAPPIACAVDSIGRAHVLFEAPGGWSVSILDPNINEGIKVFDIPYGNPTMVSPHRIAAGSDGSLYWDDVVATDTEGLWGIAKLAPSSDSGVFSLGTENSPGSEITWVYREPEGGYVRQTSALSVDSNGELRVGVQDFSLDVLNDQSMEFIDNMEAPYTSSLLHIDHSGNLISNIPSEDIVGVTSPVVDIHADSEHILGFWAGMNVGQPFGQFEGDIWIPSTGLN
ncbi:MAG: hypothetical protein NTY09_03805, partial [bacterium]|nr:hypothetical protein [bacterium]